MPLKRLKRKPFYRQSGQKPRRTSLFRWAAAVLRRCSTRVRDPSRDLRSTKCILPDYLLERFFIQKNSCFRSFVAIEKNVAQRKIAMNNVMLAQFAHSFSNLPCKSKKFFCHFFIELKVRSLLQKIAATAATFAYATRLCSQRLNIAQ